MERMQRIWLRTLIMMGIVAAVAMFWSRAHAATFQYTLNTSSGHIGIKLTGEIVPGDAARLERGVQQSIARNGQPMLFVALDSGGGSVAEALQIVQVIRAHQLWTAVGRASKCASACFMVFAAGARKTAATNAAICVHGASDQNGNEYDDATVLTAKVLKELGTPPAIIGKMVVTPPQDVVCLTVTDLAPMGVTFFDPKPQAAVAEATAPETAPAATEAAWIGSSPPPSYGQYEIQCGPKTAAFRERLYLKANGKKITFYRTFNLRVTSVGEDIVTVIGDNEPYFIRGTISRATGRFEYQQLNFTTRVPEARAMDCDIPPELR